MTSTVRPIHHEGRGERRKTARPEEHMSTQSKVIPLPDTTARRERQLLAAWATADRLKAELREAEARARKLEREVGKARGYGEFIRREALELVVRHRT